MDYSFLVQRHLRYTDGSCNDETEIQKSKSHVAHCGCGEKVQTEARDSLDLNSTLGAVGVRIRFLAMNCEPTLTACTSFQCALRS